MKIDLKYVDLHTHTNQSDGNFASNDLVELAYTNETKILSITDHDSIDGLPLFHKSLYDGMLGVDGVEFSSYIYVNNKKYKLHILGYAFDSKKMAIINLLNEMKEKRFIAHQKTLGFFKSKLKDFPENIQEQINMDRYCWFDRDVINLLKEKNYSPDIIEYFTNYFKANRFSYGKDYELDVHRVIDGIKSANGYVIFAHPMAYGYDLDVINSIIYKLIDLGIDGIEIYQSDCELRDSLYLQSIAIKNHLFCSVGSDFHKINSRDGRLISKGIDNNLCIENISFSDEILKRKLYFKGNVERKR